jgi:cytochrome c peroxidase
LFLGTVCAKDPVCLPSATRRRAAFGALLLVQVLVYGGAPFRATTFPPFDPFHEAKPGPNAFSPYSATSLSTLRQRWNFNAVRIPLVDVPTERAAEYTRALESFEQIARTLGLTPIVVGSAEDRFEVVDDRLPCDPRPDPSELTARIQQQLADLDRRAVSWTVSTFVPGALITDYAQQNATTVDNGWACNAAEESPHLPPGIGLIVQTYLWKAQMHGLYAVNAAGGRELPRGGVAIVYGPIFALKDRRTPQGPRKSSGVTIELRDSLHRVATAQLLYVSAGWGQANFVVPDGAAPGPATLTVHHSDGASTSASVTISDTAPGIWTSLRNGRGPAIALLGVTPLWSCRADVCRTVPAPVGRRTSIRVMASGLRHVMNLRATFGGRPVAVSGVGPGDGLGTEVVTLVLTAAEAEIGESDLILYADGRASNVVRLQAIPQTRARIELGRYLFYDKRLSVNGKMSCGSCHRQELAFTDGRGTAEGTTGQIHPRASMSLVNVGRRQTLTWSNPKLHSLESQALIPLTGTAPVEMGATRASVLRMLQQDDLYRTLFPAAFRGEASPISIVNLARAIAAFERTIVSNSSAYEEYRFGGRAAAISESAKRGELLFYSDTQAGCYRCHSGRDFTDGLAHNTGVSDRSEKFQTPTLRNVAVTGPYMHDGGIETLEAVIDHYNAGGRNHPPGIDERMRRLYLSPQNKQDLVAFLRTLTDPQVLVNPSLSDPW